MAAVVILSAYPFDDAYIHLRLARNLAIFGEPYFNLGERVMSGSSPLWLLWLAAVIRVTGHGSTIVAVATECLVIAAVFVTAEGFLAHACGRRWQTFVAALVVSILALPSAGGLMETPLAIALFFGGLWAYRWGGFVSAGVLLGLASAVRLEMVLPAVGALVLAPDARARGRLVVGMGPVWLAQTAGLYLAFGAFLPHAMVAKAIVYQLDRSDLLTMGPQELGRRTGACLVSILGLTTAFGAARLLPRACRRGDNLSAASLLLAALPLGLLGIYFVRVPLIFPWYWTLSVGPMALFAADQWTATTSVTASRTSRTRIVQAASAVAILLLAWSSVLSVESASCGRLERSPWVMENARTRTYLNIGSLLAERCPGATVGAAEIGALGWTYPGKILDGAGLASPEVLPYHPLRVPDERPSGGVGAIPGRAFAALRPDVVVSMDLFAVDFVRKSATLAGLSDYVLWWKEPVFARGLAATLPGGLWGSRWTAVFARSGRCRVPDDLPRN